MKPTLFLTLSDVILKDDSKIDVSPIFTIKLTHNSSQMTEISEEIVSNYEVNSSTTRAMYDKKVRNDQSSVN